MGILAPGFPGEPPGAQHWLQPPSPHVSLVLPCPKPLMSPHHQTPPCPPRWLCLCDSPPFREVSPACLEPHRAPCFSTGPGGPSFRGTKAKPNNNIPTAILLGGPSSKADGRQGLQPEASSARSISSGLNVKRCFHVLKI